MALTKVYKLYCAVSADTNAAAQVTIQRSGRIVAISLGCALDSVTDNSSAAVELSFSSSAQAATNDTVGPVAMVRPWNNFTTSGNTCPSVDRSNLSGLNIPVSAGDRLYINVDGSGTYTAYVDCFVYVE